MPSVDQIKKKLYSYVMTLSLKNPPLPKKIAAMKKIKNIHAKKGHEGKSMLKKGMKKNKNNIHAKKA
jgi:hypothetical protein